MMRRLIAAFAAALLWLAPVAASAQTLIYPSGIGAGVVTNCGTVAVSTPCLNLTQTWNAAGVTFTGVKENITDTASASGSLLLDLQVATVSKFSVSKAGVVVSASSIQSGGTVASSAGGGASIGADGSGKPQVVFGSGGFVLNGEAANTLAQRNGVSGQTFNVYNTFTDASNYERGGFRWNGNVLQLVADQAGTGTARSFEVGTTGSNTVFLMTSNVDRWAVNASGHFLANVDNTYDIGASGANRPRNAFIAGNISAGNTVTSPTFVATSYIQPGILTVGTLSTCNSGTRGARETVTDATQTFTSANFGTTVTGSGANVVPVTCDGTSWKIG